MEKEFMVIDTELNKVLYKGSYFQCQRYINATAMYDVFLGGTNWSKYQIKHCEQS